MCVRVCRWPLIRDKRVRTWRKRRRGEGNRRRGGAGKEEMQLSSNLKKSVF